MGMFSENYTGNRCGDCTWADNKESELEQLKSYIHGLAEKWRQSDMTTAQLVIELDNLSGKHSTAPSINIS